MRKGLVGVVVGAAAALGAGWAAKRLLGGGDDGAMDSFSAASAGGAQPEPLPRREGLDPVLLEILACPDDKEPVIYQREGDAERLTCTKCGKRYPVRDGIPVMLIDEATEGPIPTQQEIDAAKAMAPQGKPAIVGAAAAAAPAASSEESSAGGTDSPAPSATGTGSV